jgi:hypothetical protein
MRLPSHCPQPAVVLKHRCSLTRGAGSSGPCCIAGSVSAPLLPWPSPSPPMWCSTWTRRCSCKSRDSWLGTSWRTRCSRTCVPPSPRRQDRPPTCRRTSRGSPGRTTTSPRRRTGSIGRDTWRTGLLCRSGRWLGQASCASRCGSCAPSTRTATRTGATSSLTGRTAPPFASTGENVRRCAGLRPLGGLGHLSDPALAVCWP